MRSLGEHKKNSNAMNNPQVITIFMGSCFWHWVANMVFTMIATPRITSNHYYSSLWFTTIRHIIHHLAKLTSLLCYAWIKMDYIFIYIYSTVYLVGGFNPSEKYEYEFVRLEKIIPAFFRGSHISAMFQSPPTRYGSSPPAPRARPNGTL